MAERLYPPDPPGAPILNLAADDPTRVRRCLKGHVMKRSVITAEDDIGGRYIVYFCDRCYQRDHDAPCAYIPGGTRGH